MKYLWNRAELTDQEIVDQINKKDDDEYLGMYEIAYLTGISPNTIAGAIYTKTGLSSLRFYAERIDNTWKVRKKDAIKWANHSSARRISPEEIGSIIRNRRQMASESNKMAKYKVNEYDIGITKFDIVSMINDLITFRNGDDADITDIDVAVMVEVVILYLKGNMDIHALKKIIYRILNSNQGIDNYQEIVTAYKSRKYKTLIKLFGIEDNQ